jgi:epoxyqueuosine reductase
MKESAREIWTGARREELRGRIAELGFDVVKFTASVGPAPRDLDDWLDAGMHADMAWMERTREKRSQPALVLPGIRSIIVLGVNYWPGRSSGKQDNRAGGGSASGQKPRWARYALHDDYHDTVKPGLVAAGRVLEELCGLAPEDYRYYVDTGPVLERGLAARAGLGFLGKNGMLISRRYGNWLFLATILTRLEIEPDRSLRRKSLPPEAAEPPGLLCGKCTRCMTACPTNAIPRPGVVDARRCISYQTIENKGIIPRELRAGIGERVYGCDVCLDVCPWNRFARTAHSVLLEARTEIAGLSLGELLQLTPARFADIFRGTAIKRVKLAGLLRNACVVAGNSGDVALIPLLVKLAGHESAIVRVHAVWAVRKLAGDVTAFELLGAVRAAEKDAAVLQEYDARAV